MFVREREREREKEDSIREGERDNIMVLAELFVLIIRIKGITVYDVGVELWGVYLFQSTPCY